MGDIRKFFGGHIEPKEESPQRKRLSKTSSNEKEKKAKVEKTSKFFPKKEAPKASPDYDSSATEIIPSDQEYQKPKSQPPAPRPKSPVRKASTNKEDKKGSQLAKNKQDSASKKPAPKKSTQSSIPKTGSTIPLTGQTYVITGILGNYDRNTLTDLLKSLGAKVTGNVSKRTTCLIHGDVLEDGRHFSEGKKYKTATENGTKVMNEQDLEELLASFKDSTKVSPVDQDSLTAVKPLPIRIPAKPLASINIQAMPLDQVSKLWVDKYKPHDVNDILGNNKSVEKLIEWLKDWEDVVIHGNKKDVNIMNRGRADLTLNVNAKAALVSGPPGVGKTTSARLIARLLGYRAMEMNASDFRSKKLILDPLRATSGNQSMTGSGTIMKNLIIMDEVDGMSAGDRGGTAALIEVIKTTRVPIICICNDRQSQKLKSLSNHCYDIRFQKPNKVQVSKRLQAIMANEGLQIDPNALEQVLEASGSDIRQTLTLLEMWARSSSSINYMQAKNGLRSVSKDPLSMVGNFDAAARLLNNRETQNLNHKQKIDLFFVDFDLIPLLIHENYLTAMQMNEQTVHRMADAADSIAFSDLINQQIRTNNDWSLLPQLGQAAAIEPGFLAGAGVPFPKFPEWFGKTSTQKKNERLVRECRSAMAGHISADIVAILGEYVPLIYKMIMKPIVKHDIDGVDEAVDLIHTYGLNPEMLKEHLIQLQ